MLFVLVALAPALEFAAAQSSCGVSPQGSSNMFSRLAQLLRLPHRMFSFYAEQAALFAGKAALDPLGKSKDLSNWTSSSCACGWGGVTCAYSGGYPTGKYTV
jgi:hypothetical protein